ncbi:MAG: acyl-CoA dehydrogenase family protein [Deltaproteobacteria bacterium]|nr:acyl-CoA dehydrogenase family protein [Deltaproteobacteria bacterium]
MDFELPEDVLAFEREVVAFLEANRSDDVMDRNPEHLSQTVETPAKRAFMRKLAERGWLGMSWPKQYGGQERSGIYDFVLTEALSRFGAPQPGKGVGIVGKTIIRHGNEELKAYFLPRIIRGEIEFAIGYSEPQAGSDAASMQLKATRDDVRGGYVLDGQKIWTTSAHFADWYWVGARTSEHKHKGITLFLVPMNHPGFQIHPTWTIGDERSNEVFFNSVFVPDSHVVGKVGEGWTYICEALDLERFAMLPVGPVEMKLKGLIEYVSTATLDGEPLAQDPVVRQTIAKLAADLEVARKLQRKVISEALKNRVPTIEAAMYKMWQSQLGQRIANYALELIGPDAALKPEAPEAPAGGRYERSYRYTVVDTIGGGTSEIQRNIIAGRGLGLPKCF